MGVLNVYQIFLTVELEGARNQTEILDKCELFMGKIIFFVSKIWCFGACTIGSLVALSKEDIAW